MNPIKNQLLFTHFSTLQYDHAINNSSNLSLKMSGGRMIKNKLDLSPSLPLSKCFPPFLLLVLNY